MNRIVIMYIFDIIQTNKEAWHRIYLSSSRFYRYIQKQKKIFMKIRSDKKEYGKWFERFIPIYQHFGCGLNHEQYQRKRNTLIFSI